MRTKIKFQKIIKFTVLAMTIIIASCKKDLQTKQTSDLLQQKIEKPVSTLNPFSYLNIQKARATLNNLNLQNNLTINTIVENDQNRLYTYIRFTPNAVTGDILKQLEADTSIKILDFPFANGEIYTDEFAIDET